MTVAPGTCERHPKSPALGLCGRCDAFVCPLDSRDLRGILYCEACAVRHDLAVQEGEGRTWSRGKTARRQPWRSYERARCFVHELGLRSSVQWQQYVRGELRNRPARPDDVPATPTKVYRQEWQGWPDWLGPTAGKRWRAFDEARVFARGLGLQSGAEWRSFCKGQLASAKGRLPKDVPLHPHLATEYRGQWIDYDDWLATGKTSARKRVFLSFVDARVVVHALGIKSQNEWRRFARGFLQEKGSLPVGVPAAPERVYKDEFLGFGDWLGTGVVAPSRRRFRPFEEARAYARSLGLRSQSEWAAYCRGDLPGREPRPSDIPWIPHRTYAAEWRGFCDWLGTPEQRVERRPFAEARAFARRLGLRSVAEWRAYARGDRRDLGLRPKDVPSCPNVAYANEWAGWADWCGRVAARAPSGKARRWSFRQARHFARELGLDDVEAWEAFVRGELPDRPPPPAQAPLRPERVYRGRWQGWGDWLGREQAAAPRPTNQVCQRCEVQVLGLVSVARVAYCAPCAARPDVAQIAAHDREPRERVVTLAYEAARVLVHGAGLSSYAEWQAWARGRFTPRTGMTRPRSIPADPRKVYRTQWTTWRDWLGPSYREERMRSWRPFAEARDFARSLGLSTGKEWVLFAQGGLSERGTKPSDVPMTPHACYPEEWRGWGDFLGTGRVANTQRCFRPFEEARMFVQSLGLRSQTEWQEYSRGERPDKGLRPMDVPGNPQKVYRGRGWSGMPDWLGNGGTS